MELQGTGYIIEILIDTVKGVPIRDIDFSVSFFVYTNRRETFNKSELVHIQMNDGDKYYALLDSRKVGSGELKCDIAINDPEPRWAGGARPVILRHSTGKFIGAPCGTSMSGNVCGAYEEGYKIGFNFVYGIPKPEVAYIFYGKFIDQITSFDDLTPEMLVSPENTIISVTAGKMDKTPISDIAAGNKVVVLIPSDYGYVATKDNGIGGKVPFDTSIMGCNGEKQINVDGTPYKIFGEFMTVSGELFIYVD